jgi:hypothetical protein
VLAVDGAGHDVEVPLATADPVSQDDAAFGVEGGTRCACPLLRPWAGRRDRDHGGARAGKRKSGDCRDRKPGRGRETAGSGRTAGVRAVSAKIVP